jgi:hypothetical protein
MTGDIDRHLERDDAPALKRYLTKLFIEVLDKDAEIVRLKASVEHLGAKVARLEKAIEDGARVTHHRY